MSHLCSYYPVPGRGPSSAPKKPPTPLGILFEVCPGGAFAGIEPRLSGSRGIEVPRNKKPGLSRPYHYPKIRAHLGSTRRILLFRA